MAFDLKGLASGWKLAGALVLAAGAGASGMAASVKSSLEAHTQTTKQQQDSVIALLKDIRALQSEQLCIAVGVTPKLACLQR